MPTTFDVLPEDDELKRFGKVIIEIRMDFYGRVQRLSRSSTCLKRSVVCVLYDAEGHFLSEGFNTCDVDTEVCPGMYIQQTPETYKDYCSNTHAEIHAINRLKKTQLPYFAVMAGHDFYCPTCEKTLKTDYPWIELLAYPVPGVGLRNV